MPDLREQATAIIETCKSVLARGASLPDVDRTTFFSAQRVLADAQSQNPKDKILADTKLDEPWSWTSILTAMNNVLQSVPARKAVVATGPRSTNKITGY